MDLYEALKEGMTKEDLLKNFHKELAAADERLTNEKREAEAASKAQLNDARKDLTDSMYNYYMILMDPNGEVIKEVGDKEIKEIIDKTVTEFEDKYKSLFDLVGSLPIFSKPTENLSDLLFPKTLEKEDDRSLLKTFIDSL